MAARIYPKVLFFINGPVPSPEQLDAANAYGPGVAFRNAAMLPEDAPIEEADAVAGDVPPQYKDALPSVDDSAAVEKRMAARDPNNRTMFARGRDRVVPYDELNDDQKEARNAANLSRGAKPLPVNQRLGEPLAVENRATQSGDARVTYPEAAKADGWTSNPGGDAGGDPNDASAGQPQGGVTRDVPVPAGTPSGGAPAGAKPASIATAPASDDAAVRAAAAKAAGAGKSNPNN